jgi:hypothetical protein
LGISAFRTMAFRMVSLRIMAQAQLTRLIFLSSFPPHFGLDAITVNVSLELTELSLGSTACVLGRCMIILFKQL